MTVIEFQLFASTPGAKVTSTNTSARCAGLQTYSIQTFFFDILTLAISVLYCYINTITVKKTPLFAGGIKTTDSVSITKLQSEFFFMSR